MGDALKENESKFESKILVEAVVGHVEKLPVYSSNQPQNYYYQDPSYYQRQTPAYQQRVGGQNVYVAGSREPPNVSSGQTAYVYNYPDQQDEYQMYQDNQDIFTPAFDSVQIRNKFVQKVYMILSLQLFFSFGFLLLVAFDVIYFGTSMALVCSTNLRRNFPINFILLTILTLALTLVIAGLVALTSPIVVLAAIGTTATVCFLVSVFACQTKWDVTGCGTFLMIAMIVLLLYGMILLILTLFSIFIPILHIVYSALACLLFTFWLMYDTQLIVGGRRFELSPEEYIYGALSLYIDIMYIFMHILTLYEYCLGGQ